MPKIGFWWYYHIAYARNMILEIIELKNNKFKVIIPDSKYIEWFYIGRDGYFYSDFCDEKTGKLIKQVTI